MASGASVIGIQYNGGAIIACDTLLSYGSLAKWPNIPRIKILNERVAIAAQGDYADFQDVTRELSEELAREALYRDGIAMAPREVFSVLHRTIYSKRSEFEPALCNFVVLGAPAADGSEGPFLGGVDNIGTRWTDGAVAVGYGEHIAIPELRKALDRAGGPAGLTREAALAVVIDCLKVLFYRECRTINRFQFADATPGRIVISEPFTVDTQWDFSGFAFGPTAIIR